MDHEVLTRLRNMEQTLADIHAWVHCLREKETVREYYSTEEFAQLVGRTEYTIRQWAREGRIHSERRQSGRGAFKSYRFSHEELLRWHKDGLLPPAKPFNGLTDI